MRQRRRTSHYSHFRDQILDEIELFLSKPLLEVRVFAETQNVSFHISTVFCGLFDRVRRIVIDKADLVLEVVANLVGEVVKQIDDNAEEVIRLQVVDWHLRPTECRPHLCPLVVGEGESENILNPNTLSLNNKESRSPSIKARSLRVTAYTDSALRVWQVHRGDSLRSQLRLSPANRLFISTMMCVMGASLDVLIWLDGVSWSQSSRLVDSDRKSDEDLAVTDMPVNIDTANSRGALNLSRLLTLAWEGADQQGSEKREEDTDKQSDENEGVSTERGDMQHNAPRSRARRANAQRENTADEWTAVPEQRSRRYGRMGRRKTQSLRLHEARRARRPRARQANAQHADTANERAQSQRTGGRACGLMSRCGRASEWMGGRACGRTGEWAGDSTLTHLDRTVDGRARSRYADHGRGHSYEQGEPADGGRRRERVGREGRMTDRDGYDMRQHQGCKHNARSSLLEPVASDAVLPVHENTRHHPASHASVRSSHRATARASERRANMQSIGWSNSERPWA
ncbi:uncharacterized protein B0H18DRAFT_1101751 [Fomitopsis serialis]|uniref:uncharacterized protein n=1 Tax=Fomitopsis serialis TaxID=139415 RepID=UPI002008457A|nr:uncharacterized protein B0H18DRAFT_1101751 [Neoantrodia serialis]KAH9934226.1 hypothetical protein B0H18DRAFT_1101751 [Neoantrodia serialis]